MSAPISFTDRSRRWLVLALAILVSLLLLSLDKGHKLSLAESMGGVVFAPAHKILSYLGRVTSIYEENKRLRKLATWLALENQQMGEIQLENRRLREMLGFKERRSLKLIPAEVIGRDPSRPITSLLVDQGRVSGVEPDLPVVVAAGLVGRVMEASQARAGVLLLTDPSCKVSVMVQRSRVFGLLEGDGVGCKLRNVPVQADVKKGDEIISSGWGGVFPQGLKIGSVLKVSADITQLSKEVMVKPAVDLSHLEEIFILKEE